MSETTAAMVVVVAAAAAAAVTVVAAAALMAVAVALVMLWTDRAPRIRHRDRATGAVHLVGEACVVRGRG